MTTPLMYSGVFHAVTEMDEADIRPGLMVTALVDFRGSRGIDTVSALFLDTAQHGYFSGVESAAPAAPALSHVGQTTEERSYAAYVAELFAAATEVPATEAPATAAEVPTAPARIIPVMPDPEQRARLAAMIAVLPGDVESGSAVDSVGHVRVILGAAPFIRSIEWRHASRADVTDAQRAYVAELFAAVVQAANLAIAQVFGAQ